MLCRLHVKVSNSRWHPFVSRLDDKGRRSEVVIPKRGAGVFRRVVLYLDLIQNDAGEFYLKIFQG
jgi:hypothetical protein